VTIKFPKRRDDQSFAVAAIFSLTDSAVVSLVRAYTGAWVRANERWSRIWRSNTIEVEELDFDSEFLAIPRIEQLAGESTFAVVFECRLSSTRWKDWMMHMVDDLSRVFPEAKFERFES
jgi:hypothetical protein